MAGWYDLIALSEKNRFRRRQIELAGIKEGERVLEVGCGTGSLSILAKLAVGESGRVEGTDIAPRMIERAQDKARRYGLDITFKVASIDDLPYEAESFDMVISSMMFHHLPVEVKRKGLREVHRILKKGGRLYLADFCRSHLLTIPIMYLIDLLQNNAL
jgi:ubiquinone/menaquinone biosynthesis C-methylase UbiE